MPHGVRRRGQKSEPRAYQKLSDALVKAVLILSSVWNKPEINQLWHQVATPSHHLEDRVSQVLTWIKVVLDRSNKQRSLVEEGSIILGVKLFLKIIFTCVLPVSDKK